MMFTRIALRNVKPLWSSVTPWQLCLKHIIPIPCRSITTEQDHARFGLFSKKKNTEEDAEKRALDMILLDPMMGIWNEEETTNFVPFMQEAGLSISFIKNLERFKTWIAFSRLGEDWICRYGLLRHPIVRSIVFKLGRKTNGDFIDGTPMETLFEQDMKFLKERQKTLIRPRRVIDIVRRADGDTLTANYTCNDVNMKRVYSRRDIEVEELT